MKSPFKILSLLFVLISINVYSQTVTPPNDVSLNLELTQAKTIPDEILDTLVDPMSILISADTLIISAFMIAEDTLVLSKIHVKLGTTDGGGDLLTHSFDFDSTPSGDLTYQRTGNIIKVGLGQFTYLNTFYYEAYFEDTTGNLSAVTKYIAD